MPFELGRRMSGCWKVWCQRSEDLDNDTNDPSSAETVKGRVQLDASEEKMDPERSLLEPVPFQSWVHRFVRQVLSARI